ncbi:hypothetical protein H0H92_001849, partial [Tricholoma furcatifolium]
MPKLAISSSPEEWEMKGKELFERKKYLQAKHCYERAMKPHEAAISDAYYRRDQARKLPVSDLRHTKDQRQGAFIQAAKAFFACGQSPGKFSTVYFRRSAECYEAGADELQAAKIYLQFVHDYDMAAKIYRKLGHFDEA